MSPELLLREFERIGDAPGAVLRLRRFVLDLAVRGKLVAPSNGDARSQAEDVGRMDSPTTFHPSRAPLNNTPEPFPAPDGWTWFPLAQLSHVEMGQSPASEHYNQSGDGIPFYQGKTDFGPHHPSPRYWCTKPTKIAQPGDILISVRAPVGPTNIASEICCIGRGLTALRPYEGVNRDYLLIALRAFEAVLADMGFGTTFVAINKSQLITFPIPLPPLAEQHRIVARVDELMALCDQLEATQKDRELQRDALRSVSLHRLTEHHEPADVRSFLDMSRRLITKPEHLAAVRQTILDLAVRGRLVPQDSGDEPITGSDTSNGRVPAIAADERPFELPESWEWRRLGLVAALINGDRSKNYPNKNEYLSNGVAWINTGHIDPDGTLSKTRMYYISRAKFDSLRAGKIRSGDLVYCLRGATFGKTAIVDGFEEGAVASSLVIIRVDQVVAIPTYVRLYLISPTGQQLIRRFDNGSAQPNLAASSVKLFVTPLPPLAEQHRIVAKVDELMAVCDELEAALDCAQHERVRLLESLLSDALNVAPDRPGDIQD